MKQVRKLEGERVRMFFLDGREELARLLCATKDMDGSEHLVYERLESESGELASRTPSPCLYANARTVLSIEPVTSANVA
jgi:hypothetical protein